MYKIIKKTGGVTEADGFFTDGKSAGLRPDGGVDTAFIYSDTLCDVAHKFTTNKMQAAPIKHFLKHSITQTNFILINAKNANAMTSQQGINDIEEILQKLNAHHKKELINPIMSSTGVIGVALPKEKILLAAKEFDLNTKNPKAAASAIMTTDTFAKTTAYEVVLENGESFSIGAMAKGAGMINPAMATMLCFITTDADIDAKSMQNALDAATKTTFNAISVDGDTSTNDTVLLLSNKKSGCYDKEAFYEVLEMVMLELAKMMVEDGEGATKLVTYELQGATNNTQAEIAAKALSDSLLMKTALFGEDPNWGRVASTIGASGVDAVEEQLSIYFDEICVYNKGENLFDLATEEKAAAVMKQKSFTIRCDLGIGNGSFTAYGCDLGYEYVKINADYRT